MNGNLRRFFVMTISGIVIASLVGSAGGIWAVKSELVEIRTILVQRIIPMVEDHEARIRSLEETGRTGYGPQASP